jgi:hypothetical protein
MIPVHGKGDAIGKHRGERGLDGRLDSIRQYSLVRHVCQQALCAKFGNFIAFGNWTARGSARRFSKSNAASE